MFGGNKQIAGVLAIMSAVGICTPPACADVTGRQQESGGEREHRMKRSSSA